MRTLFIRDPLTGDIVEGSIAPASAQKADAGFGDPNMLKAHQRPSPDGASFLPDGSVMAVCAGNSSELPGTFSLGSPTPRASSPDFGESRGDVKSTLLKETAVSNTPVAPATTFSFQDIVIAAFERDGLLWLEANQVCQALEYANPRTALANHVDEGDVLKADTPTASGVQTKNFVNESGLYALIFGSKKDSAKIFKRWVTSEVLPAIRKTGAYQAPQAPAPQAVRLHHPHTSPDVPIRATTHQGAAWYRLGDVGWQLGVDAYLLARHIPKGESALLKVRDRRYGWQRCWWASAAGVNTALCAFAHKPAAARVREYLQLPAALPAPQPSLAGLPDGRYLLVVDGGRTHIRDIRDKAVVDNRFVWALRKNFKTLSEQMRLLTGEAGECVLDLQLQDLRGVQS